MSQNFGVGFALQVLPCGAVLAVLYISVFQLIITRDQAGSIHKSVIGSETWVEACAVLAFGQMRYVCS